MALVAKFCFAMKICFFTNGNSVVLLFLKHFKSLAVMDEEQLYQMLCMLLFHCTVRAC